MSETNQDIFEYAKDLAKAEKELKICKWVTIDIGYYQGQEFICLYRYDLPKEVYDRRKWIVRWRCARFQCQNPRKNIGTWFSFYDKRSGLQLGFGTELSRLAAAKAQVTKVERNIKRYIEENKSSLFFDEQNDEILTLAKEKLMSKKSHVQAAEERLERLVQNNKICTKARH